MFDPEHKDIDCPKCFRRKVYFDRKIGYYCMFCAHEFSIEEALYLIEGATTTSRPAPDSRRAARMPVVEIKEQRRRLARTDHIIPGSNKPQNKKYEWEMP